MTTAAPAHLVPSYDPTKALVSTLRGILLSHDVPYSATAKKPELVALFEQHVRPQAPRLLAQLSKVKPSSQGILDGESTTSSLQELDTGSESAADEAERRTTKKSKTKGKGKVTSRKSVKAKQREEEEEDEMELDDEPEPVKHSKVRKARASSRQPADRDESNEPLAGVQKRKASTEPEEFVRMKSPGSSGQKDRRVSLKYESGGETGFSDYNPFQSAGEETPERKLKRRKSSMGPVRQSGLAGPSTSASARKSLPASLHARRTAGAWADDEPTSSPAVQSRLVGNRLPASPATPGVKYMVPVSQVKTTPPEAAALKRRLAQYNAPPSEDEEQPEHDFAPEPDFQEEEYDVPLKSAPSSSPPARSPARRSDVVARRPVSPPAQASTPLGKGRALRRKISNIASSPTKSIVVRSSRAGPLQLVQSEGFKRFSIASLLLALLCFTGWWREEKLAAGFCDTGTSTNLLIQSRTNSLALHSVVEWSPTVPQGVLDVLDEAHLRPSCTTCPTHGHCVDGAFIGCSVDYVPQQHPLRLGGLLPLAPHCVPDTERQLLVARQASKAAKLLRGRRGEVVCSTALEKERKKTLRAEGWVYGLSFESLMTALQMENKMSGSPITEHALEEVNRLALRDLEAHNEVIVHQQGNDFWYAAKTADMPLSCQARLAVVRSAQKHQSTLGGLLATILGALWLRLQLAGRRAENEKVRKLVQTVLNELRKQEHQHHVDPALVPQAYMAQSHLRDLILQHEHSPARRQRLWTKVEKVVEGNANVRASQIEHNGEELRAWEWTGTGGGQIEGSGTVYPSLK